MIDENPNIILNSKYKKVQYHMYSSRIIVTKGNDKLYIELPQKDNAICFHDMYYVKENIQVIVATRGCYDVRYILDENEFELIDKHLTK